MKKRGSHVGVVLSFVIFVTFLIFLYSIIEPTMRMQRDKESLLDYLKIELIKRFSTDLTSVTVKINETINPNQNCIKLRNFISETEMKPPRIIVKNESREIQYSYIEGDDLKIDRGSENNLFFKVYNSSEFNEISEATINPCPPINEDDYDIGLTKTNEYIFEKKVIEIISEYGSEDGYENLKDELNIPLGSEFGFSLVYSNETRIGTEEKEISTSIYAREILVQYVDSEATIHSGFINVRVW